MRLFSNRKRQIHAANFLSPLSVLIIIIISSSSSIIIIRRALGSF